jgi:hypothetical protein
MPAHHTLLQTLNTILILIGHGQQEDNRATTRKE